MKLPHNIEKPTWPPFKNLIHLLVTGCVIQLVFSSRIPNVTHSTNVFQAPPTSQALL